MASLPISVVHGQLKGMGYNSNQAGKIDGFIAANPHLKNEIMYFAKVTLQQPRPPAPARVSTRDIPDFFKAMHNSVVAGGAKSKFASVKRMPNYVVTQQQQRDNRQRSNSRNRSNGQPQRKPSQQRQQPKQQPQQQQRPKQQYRSRSADTNIGLRKQREFLSTAVRVERGRDQNKKHNPQQIYKEYLEKQAARSALKVLAPTTSEGLSESVARMWEFRGMINALLPSSWAFIQEKGGVEVVLGDAEDDGLIHKAHIVFHAEVPIDLGSPQQNTARGAATFVRSLNPDAAIVEAPTRSDPELEKAQTAFPGAFRNEHGQIVLSEAKGKPEKQRSPASTSTLSSIHAMGYKTASDDQEDEDEP